MEIVSKVLFDAYDKNNNLFSGYTLIEKKYINNKMMYRYTSPSEDETSEFFNTEKKAIINYKMFVKSGNWKKIIWEYKKN